MKVYLNFGFYLLITFVLLGCQASDDEEQPAVPDETVVEDDNENPIENLGACYKDTYEPTPDDHVAKLDILIVSYNSINLKPHRKRLSDNIHHLFAQIPDGVDYRVAVMPGLGSHSSKSGKLYQRSSEPYVLRSDSMDVSEMKSHINQKLNPPVFEVVLETLFGGGSMGLYSLYKGLEDNVDEIQSQGLLRDEASLLVLQITDQADVCARYPDNVDTFNRRFRSTHLTSRNKAFERDCFIENDLGESIQLDVHTVYEKLKENTSGALNISGILYNNQATVPHTAWKEYGYGYIDLIEKAGGITHDLASSNYDEALTKIGLVSSASVIQNDKFNLQTNTVLASTIDVEVDGQDIDFSFIPELNQVHLNESRSSASRVEVEYCERKEAEVENVALVSGGNHSCVLQRDNGIRCWGMNAAGQLGLGHTENIGDDEPIYSAEPIFFENKITNLAAGGFHTCALDEIGDVYCWGGNDYGQLGYGDTVNRGVTELATSLSPVSLGQKAKKIYAGTFLTCAILENDTARCWGLNRSGQLGLGHVEPIGDNELPTDVPALTFSKEISQFDLSTVSNHVCALFVDGAQKCWGDNLRGQLGLGDKDNRGDNELLSDVPFISVDNNADPIFVATGNEHTCVLLDNQNMKCWGRNTFNMFEQPLLQLAADGDKPSDYATIDFGTSISSFSTGNYFNCAISTSNQVKCWGDNRFGQVGYKTPDSQLGESTALVDIPFIELGDYQVERVVAGGFHACVLTKAKGQVMCWGSNRFGQLGYGDTVSTSDNGALTPLERGVIDFNETTELN